MTDDTLDSAAAELEKIVEGDEVPGDVKDSLEDAIESLREGGDEVERAAGALNVINDVSNDPNVPMHVRTTLWNVSGELESVTVED